ncbi:MAG TPA: alcohol dehydrogenase catalytic domain-containing protein [Actinomycetaceae bacterium]|nr:alcohol dehydrogenase catalytic domain-containing protein [Actinomycetaceae bacterium]
MRALELQAPNRYRIIELPDPEPGPGEIVIEVDASGICGTDLRIVEGDYGHISFPLVIGHEFGGRVSSIGDGVSGLAVGDLVGADPNIYCGNCEWCNKRAFNLCANWSAVGINRTGALAEKVVVPARLAVRLPASLDPETAALIEPLSCVLHAMDRADVASEGSMLVYGAGAIGLMALVVARSRGLTVSVIEPHEQRQAVAAGLGAVATAGDAAGLGLGADGKFDYVLDASGALPAIAEGLGQLRTRGTFIQMGVAPTAATLPFSPYYLYEREWRIIGSNSVADCYEAAAEAMPELAEQLRVLITHRLPLEDFDEALRAMASPDAIKVHLHPNEGSSNP